MLTYRDVIDHLTNWKQGSTFSAQQNTMRRAIQRAYRDVAMAWPWECMKRRGRIALVAPYETGTIAYTASTRTVALTTGTWPSWTVGATIRVGDIDAVVASVSGANAVLDTQLCFDSNIAAGTSYELFRQYYLLPEDFLQFDSPFPETLFGAPAQELTPEEWLEMERIVPTGPSTCYYTIMHPPNENGRLAIYFSGRPEEVETVDFIYRKKPRDMKVSGYLTAETQGTATVTGTAVTGSGTAFASYMVGSVLRIGRTTSVPTGLDGQNPYAVEQKISAVGSTTGVTLSATAQETLSTGGGIAVSDPVDLPEILWDAFLCRCEEHLERASHSKTMGASSQMYQEALFEARKRDNPIANSHRRYQSPFSLRDIVDIDNIDS